MTTENNSSTQETSLLHSLDGRPVKNTDLELWRELDGDYYADSIHVTATGAIGINVGGSVYVMPVKAWHRLATLRSASPAESGGGEREEIPMKIKVPAKTVEACDICQRVSASSLLTKCRICGKEYCHICEAIMCGCVHQPEICKECAKNEAVRAAVETFAPRLMRVLNARDVVLAGLVAVVLKPTNRERKSASDKLCGGDAAPIRMKNTKTTLAASRSHQHMVRALENAVVAHQELADAYAENGLPMACEATRAKVADFKRRLEKAKRPNDQDQAPQGSGA